MYNHLKFSMTLELGEDIDRYRYVWWAFYCVDYRNWD